MPNIAEVLLLCVATTESVLGILGNGFIALVNCTDCVRRKKFPKISFLLTGLAMCRTCLMWILMLDAYAKVFSPHMLVPDKLNECINFVWIIMNHMSVWFVTNLNIFYLLKIANFSHCIFLWLKGRINTVFIFLKGCFFVSWLISFPFTVKLIKQIKMHRRNASWEAQMKNNEIIINYMLANIGTLFFLWMALIASILLIVSLWRHKRQMKSSVSGPRDLSIEAHMKAIKVLISFIILFVLYFLGIFIETLCSFIPENKLLFIFGLTTTSMYPCCHSFVLILANSRLKQASLRVLYPLKCCEKQRDLRAP